MKPSAKRIAYRHLLETAKTAGGKARAEIHTRKGFLFIFLSCKTSTADAPIKEHISKVSIEKDYKALMKVVGRAKKALGKLEFQGGVSDTGPMGPTVQTSPNEVFTFMNLGEPMGMALSSDVIPDIIKALESAGLSVQVK